MRLCFREQAFDRLHSTGTVNRMNYLDQRHELLQMLRKMHASGLAAGSSGNISTRLPHDDGLFLVSPSGLSYDTMREEDLLIVDFNATVVEGYRQPTSELDMHLAVYGARPDCSAVVHTHSPYATTFACLRQGIPAVHYLVGFAGSHVPVAEYATFGSRELGRNAVRALGEGNAVLLANHGLLAVGGNLAAAWTVAEQIEFVARVYYQAQCVGEAVILGHEEMQHVRERLRGYGTQNDCSEGG
jgi:L-fuculose-phosphate aldolase